MEAVGQLAGGIAHDFNNLLQAINGYTDLAISEIPEGSHAREMLGEVAKAGHRAAGLVSQLLAFSRRQVMKPESLNLNSVIADLMKMLGRVIPENIRLSFVPGHRLEPIYCDRGMIEQVIMNLCVNARDAMPEGGKLTLETANASIEGDFCDNHPWAQPGRFVLLTVADTGCGMDKDTVSHLFEPFFTTKEVGKGTGLGLATVYGIVKQHEGMIHTSSEPGKGAAFRVYLPTSERADQAPETGRRARSKGERKRFSWRKTTKWCAVWRNGFWMRAGYTVLLARNGEEAVEIFERHAHDVDLLLMDVVMPQMGGREAYERTRSIRSGVPVVFSSGYSEDAIHANFLLEQGLTLIQKPFSRETLLRAVRRALDEQRGKK
jgi:CheY-like chemotaxis protein